MTNKCRKSINSSTIALETYTTLTERGQARSTPTFRKQQPHNSVARTRLASRAAYTDYKTTVPSLLPESYRPKPTSHDLPPRSQTNYEPPHSRPYLLCSHNLSDSPLAQALFMLRGVDLDGELVFLFSFGLFSKGERKSERAVVFGFATI